MRIVVSQLACVWSVGVIRLVIVSLFTFPAVFAGSGAARGEELNADRLFDPGRLSEIQIEIPEADWNTLRLQTRDLQAAFKNPTEKRFTYSKASVTIDGVKIESVGVRKKGFLGSLDDHWPSLKINFDQYVAQNPIPGLDTLTLNNNKQVPSLISQFLAYRLFNAAGIHAPRVGFARVTVNGEYMGVYSNVESMGRPFLNRRFGESSGQLYEGTLSDFHPSALGNLESKFNRKSGPSSATVRLAQMLASKEPLDLAEVEKLVDLDSFLRFWALEGLIVFWDGYSNNQNNYWVYAQPGGKHYFMPWGADMAFTGGDSFLGLGGVTVYAESMLANRLYRTEGIPERYRQAMLELLDAVWNESELLATIDGVEALVGDSLHKRQSGVKNEFKAVRKFVSTRRDAVARQLKKWPAKVPEQPRKPVYSVSIGEVKGRFLTQWFERPPETPSKADASDLRLLLNGEEVVFEKLEVSAQPAPRPPLGGPGRQHPGRSGADRPGARTDDKPIEASTPVEAPPTPAAIVFTGVRASDSKKVTFTLTIERSLFIASPEKSVPMRGTLMVGQEKFSIFNPFAGRTLTGQIKLIEAGVTAGDRVSGDFEATISETHGGFAGRRGP